jgi:membrane-bound lytic murein transglycosylase D
MRARSLLLSVASLLGACAPMRPGLPQDPTPPAMVRHESAAPAPATRTSELGCLTHPSIDRWEKRLRYEQRFWATVVHGMGRGAPQLPRMREIIAEEGLPSSLALLPLLESGFRPTAGRASRSRGLWQIEPATARRFGLVVDKRRDDRLHVERATRAAARYLRALHSRYGDWPLALAAYNAGEGRVDRALARRPGAGFWELVDAGRLPRISRDYVPRFLALVRVVERPAACTT